MATVKSIIQLKLNWNEYHRSAVSLAHVTHGLLTVDLWINKVLHN